MINHKNIGYNVVIWQILKGWCHSELVEESQVGGNRFFAALRMTFLPTYITMKKIITILIVSCIFSLQIFAQEQIIVPLNEPKETGVLIIDHIKGSIQVTGYEGEVVIVNASSRISKTENQNLTNNSGLKRIASNSIQLSAQEKNNEVVVTTNSHRGTIDLEIRVPIHFSLKLKTLVNGEILVQNVSGNLEITNINGDVKLENVSGSAVVNTVDGHILANFKQVTPNVPMAFSSIEGKIDVTFPADIKAYVKMKSDNGDIFSDFKIEIDQRKTQVNRTDKTGVYKISLEDWTNGKINNGGPEILLKTLEGNIYIRKGN